MKEKLANTISKLNNATYVSNNNNQNIIGITSDLNGNRIILQSNLKQLNNCRINLVLNGLESVSTNRPDEKGCINQDYYK